MKTCAFTGHRPQNLPFGFNEEDERCIDLKKALREQIINLIENEGVTHFISGMAIGVDMYAAEIVLGLKASYLGITLESAIPCESQAAKWSEALRDRYFDIASKCDKENMRQLKNLIHTRRYRCPDRGLGWKPQRNRKDRQICSSARQICYDH